MIWYLYVLLVSGIAGLALAKKRRPRRRNNFVAIPFETTITLGALVDNVVVVADLFASDLAEDFYAISVDASWAMFENTSTENPIGVGFTHNDLSVSEIAENLTAEVTDPSDIIARERSRRPVRKVGQFAGPDPEQSLNHGDQIRTTLKFMIGNGHQLAAYAVNRSNATLTTGTLISVLGTVYGRWVR